MLKAQLLTRLRLILKIRREVGVLIMLDLDIEEKYEALPSLPSPSFSIASDDPIHDCPNPPAKKQKKWRLSCKNIFLTYPKAGDLKLELILERIKSKYPALSYILICKEKHKNGEFHYHVVLHNPNKFNITNEHLLDFICGKHGNYDACRDVPSCIVYCKKDGEFLEEGIVPLDKNQSGFVLALGANTVKDAMDIIIKNHPRDYALHGMQIEQNISNLITKRDEYIPRYDILSFRPTDVMRDWVNNNLRLNKDRFRMLFIISPANYGKTQWARSLGKHLFFRNNVDMSELRTIQKEEIEYIVFDDIPWEWIKEKKALTLGMGECIVTDKYVRKMKVNVNIPSIYLCNDYVHLDDYYRSQVDFVQLTEKLF